MGTRIEDQPPEHWAGPESLDPTPVWKQFALIGIFLVLGLVLLGGVALFAAAPQLATPPALVPGDRLVLPRDSVPAVGTGPRLVGQPVIDDGRSFYLVQPANGEVLAFRARWAERPGAEECLVSPAPGRPTPQQLLASGCAAASGQRARHHGWACPSLPDAGAHEVRPQELPLSGPAEGLPDLAIRPSAEREGMARAPHRKADPNHARASRRGHRHAETRRRRGPP